MSLDNITLTSGMQQNLVALQNTATNMNKTEEALSTGKKVNSALDNPVDFFAAQSLNNTAAQLSSYSDGMSNALQTIQAANQGISSITSLINSAKALAQAAVSSQSSSSSGSFYTTDNITLSNVAAGDKITVNGCTFTAVASGASVTQFNIGANDAQTAQNLATVLSTGAATCTFTIQSVNGNVINIADGAGAGTTNILSNVTSTSSSFNVSTIAATITGNQYKEEELTFTNVAAGDKITIGGTTLTAVAANVTAGTTQFNIGASDAQTTENVANAIAATAGICGGFSVQSVNGNSLILAAGTGAGTTDISSSQISSSNSINGTVIPAATAENSQTTNLVNQYNSILSQIDGLAQDSGFQGTNLLNNASPTAMVVNFGNNHVLNVQGYETTSTGLGLNTANGGWLTSTDVNSDLTRLSNALTTLQSQSTSMSNSLAVIQTRQDFSTQMENVLQTGANNLTLADTNQEGANMLMLQTQQSLGTTALSLSSQAAQSVLKLFA